MALAEKYDKKVEAADLPVKTKDQIRKFLADKEITDTQFKQIHYHIIHHYNYKDSDKTPNGLTIKKWQ